MSQNINTVAISAALQDDDYLIVSIDGTLRRILVSDLKALIESEGTGGNTGESTVTSGGLTENQITALDGMFKVCAYIKDDVTTEYNAFKTAFGITDSGNEEPDTPITPTVTLSSISATYTGGDVTVGTDINSLTGITVTALYSDGTSKTVTDYTLSGSIVEGSNTITVSYDGKTTTFTVTGYVEQSGESGGLTEEELAQLETMPDAYLSDGGEYLYVNPLNANVTNVFTYLSGNSYVGESYAQFNASGLVNYTQLDTVGNNVFNGLIPYASNPNDENGYWSNAGFRDSTEVPDLCYGYVDSGATLKTRTGIEAYNQYVNNGDVKQYLYDKFRRLPIKISSSMAVFEVTDEVLATLSGTPSTTPNEQGFYAGFFTTSLGNGMGVWTNDNVICSHGGIINFSSGNSACEHYRCRATLNRFYYNIPQENISDLTLEGYKAYMKTQNIKFFYIASE